MKILAHRNYKSDMTIISSQRYRNWNIIEKKISELEESGAESVTIPVVNAHKQDEDGDDLYIVIDNHHLMVAAHTLGLDIEFEEVRDDMSSTDEIRNHDGDAILENWFHDSTYYYIDFDEDSDDMIGQDVW